MARASSHRVIPGWFPLAATLTIFVAACSGDIKQGADRQATVGENDKNDRPLPKPTFRASKFFDEHGNLLSSGESVFGVELPVGLKQGRNSERVKSYDSEIPIEKVMRFFGPRLLGGRAERVGKGAVYRRVGTSDKDGDYIVDVSIFLLPPRNAMVEIRRIDYPNRPTPTQTEIDAMFKDFKELD